MATTEKSFLNLRCVVAVLICRVLLLGLVVLVLTLPMFSSILDISWQGYEISQFCEKNRR